MILDRLQSSPRLQRLVTGGLLALILLVATVMVTDERHYAEEMLRESQDRMAHHVQDAVTTLHQDLDVISQLLLADLASKGSLTRSYLTSRHASFRSIQWLGMIGNDGRAPQILHGSALLGGFDPQQDPSVANLLARMESSPVGIAVPATYRDSVSLAIAVAITDGRGGKHGIVLALVDSADLIRSIALEIPRPIMEPFILTAQGLEIARYPRNTQLTAENAKHTSTITVGQMSLTLLFKDQMPPLASYLLTQHVLLPTACSVLLLIGWLIQLRLWRGQSLTPAHIPPGMGFAVVQTRRRHLEVAEATPALAHLLGIEPDQVVGRPLIALICGELVDLPADGVLHPIHPHARAKWLRLTISPSSQQRQLVLIEDVTDQRQKELRTFRVARLRQLAQICGQFAHDLKQPLNIIRLGAENAMSEPTDDDAHRQGLMIAMDQTARMHEMIDGIRDAARPIALRPGPLVVIPILRAAMTQLMDRLNQNSIQLTWHPDLATPMALGHENRLFLALFHLLRNACDVLSLRVGKDERDLPLLRVSCHNLNGQVGIIIEDNGPGMPQSVLDAIHAAHPTSAPPGNDGLGLGLTLALGIIAEMEGDLDVSTSPDGTVITIRLPALQRQWTPADALKTKPTVLVVDDEVQASTAMADYLGRHGWDARVAAGGNAGWQMFTDIAPHAVITDLHMPDGDGWSLIARIHSLAPDVPIIVVSSAEGGDTRRAIRAGATLILEKPVGLEEILQELTDLTASADY